MDSTRAADLAADLSATPDYDVGLVSLNQWQIAWRRFRRHRLAMFGAGLFFSIVAGAIVLPFFFPYDFYTIPTPDPACRIGCPPSAEHWFGTTGGLQRDVFTLVVNGARISLAIGIGAALGAAIIGAIVGGIAGFFGGWIDNALMRVVDVLLSLPLLFVILVVAKFLGGGNWFVVLLVFTLFGWAGIARLVRSPVPDPAQRGLRRGRAGGRRQQPPDHLPPHPAQRREPDHRRLDAGRGRCDRGRGVRQLPRLRRRRHHADVGQRALERADVHPPGQLVVAVLPGPRHRPDGARHQLHG